jgi:hypothetical protein
MEFLLGVIKVLAGAFVLFTVARITYGSIGQRTGWGWVAMVGALAITNMVVHRLLGSTINPPFFTAVLFGISLAGLAPQDSLTVTTWYKRAIYSVIIGTIIGWFTYMEIVPVR